MALLEGHFDVGKRAIGLTGRRHPLVVGASQIEPGSHHRQTDCGVKNEAENHSSLLYRRERGRQPRSRAHDHSKRHPHRSALALDALDGPLSTHLLDASLAHWKSQAQADWSRVAGEAQIENLRHSTCSGDRATGRSPPSAEGRRELALKQAHSKLLSLIPYRSTAGEPFQCVTTMCWEDTTSSGSLARRHSARQRGSRDNLGGPGGRECPSSHDWRAARRGPDAPAVHALMCSGPCIRTGEKTPVVRGQIPAPASAASPSGPRCRHETNSRAQSEPVQGQLTRGTTGAIFSSRTKCGSTV